MCLVGIMCEQLERKSSRRKLFWTGATCLWAPFTRLYGVRRSWSFATSDGKCFPSRPPLSCRFSRGAFASTSVFLLACTTVVVRCIVIFACGITLGRVRFASRALTVGASETTGWTAAIRSKCDNQSISRSVFESPLCRHSVGTPPAYE